jgi:hypothetical protein
VAAKLKEADPHAAEVLAALREAIGKTTDPGGRAFSPAGARLRGIGPQAIGFPETEKELVGRYMGFRQLGAQKFAGVPFKSTTSCLPVILGTHH